MTLNTVIQRLASHRWITVLAIAALVVGLGRFISDLGIDNSLEVWFVEDDPALISYKDFLEEFGNDEVIVSALHSERSAFDLDRLERLKQLTDRLVEDPDVERVWSLATIGVPQPTSEGLALAPVLDLPLTEEDIALARSAVHGGRLASSLVGKDSTTLLLFTWLKASPDIDQRRGAILERIRATFDSALEGTGEEALHAGMGVVYDALNQATFGEGALFIGLSYVVIAIALYLITRRILWTGLALLVVTLTDVTLFGLMGAMDRPLNMITMAIPALVMILGVANIVHMATALDAGQGRRPQAFYVAVLAAITIPCALNAMTTAGGFLSLTTASMAITRDYGLFAATGVALAFLFSAAAMATVLPVVPRLKPVAGSRQRISHAVERLLVSSFRHRTPVLAGGMLIFIVAGWGIGRIEIDTNSLDFLPADHEFRRHSAIIEEKAGFYMPLEFTLETETPDGWKNVQFLRSLFDAQMALEEDSSFGRTTSIADVLMDIGSMYSSRSIQSFWDAMTEEEGMGLLQAFERTADEAALRYFVSRDGRKVRLMTFVPMTSAKTFMAFADRAESTIRDHMGPAVEIAVTGYLPLYGQMISHILRDQINSLALAFVVIFFLIALVLRSGFLSIVAIALNVIPVAVVLGFMGFAGIRLDIATVTIAAALLGIIVDDTVHLLYQLRASLAGRDTLEEALREVGRHSGLAVVSTSFIFCLGFGVIALAGLRSVAYVGLLISVGVATALVADIILMPALLSLHSKTEYEAAR